MPDALGIAANALSSLARRTGSDDGASNSMASAPVVELDALGNAPKHLAFEAEGCATNENPFGNGTNVLSIEANGSTSITRPSGGEANTLVRRSRPSASRLNALGTVLRARGNMVLEPRARLRPFGLEPDALRREPKCALTALTGQRFPAGQPIGGNLQDARELEEPGERRGARVDRAAALALVAAL